MAGLSIPVFAPCGAYSPPEEDYPRRPIARQRAA